MTASFVRCLTGAAAGPQHLAPLAAGGQNRAAQHPDLGVALSAQQLLDHADEEVLDASLCVPAGAVAEDVREHGAGVGHVVAVGQQDVCAFGCDRKEKIRLGIFIYK